MCILDAPTHSLDCIFLNLAMNRFSGPCVAFLVSGHRISLWQPVKFKVGAAKLDGPDIQNNGVARNWTLSNSLLGYSFVFWTGLSDVLIEG
jgi:hypothetical protein